MVSGALGDTKDTRSEDAEKKSSTCGAAPWAAADKLVAEGAARQRDQHIVGWTPKAGSEAGISPDAGISPKAGSS